MENKRRKNILKMLDVKWLDFKYTNALLKFYIFYSQKSKFIFYAIISLNIEYLI